MSPLPHVGPGNGDAHASKASASPRLRPGERSEFATTTTIWTPLTVRQWYGVGERLIEVTSATALWYHAGLPPVPVRWVLIRDPQGRFATQALLSTDLEA